MTRTLTIAVIDDDDGIRAAIVGLIRSAGYEVDQFHSAEGYLESPRREVFDCVVTDIEMGGLNGLDLLDMIRSHNARMPVLVMTALLDPSLRSRALNSGASCFLAKPFEADALFECLENAIAKRG